MEFPFSARSLRVAIVGSGPSGFYAAEALLKQNEIPLQIDMFDRLPTPYGLVRGGVAPDHQKIKGVIAVYEKTALSKGFRFFGNVKIGRDLQVSEMRRWYDQIVYAVGNESDRKLGIPGEDLLGSRPATAFVGWYNGHPDFQEQSFDLSCESAAVVGVGNVAMDVTRLLAKDPASLAATDIADYALAALKTSRIRTIYLLGRRGPAQAAFSPAEIREIGELDSSDLVVRPEGVELGPESKKDYEDPENKKNVDYLGEVARKGEGSKSKKVRLRLCVSPIEILGENGKASAVKIEKNRLVLDEKGSVKAVGTGQYETLPAGLVLRSVGYRGIPIPGVPFDERSARIPNAEGRVLEAALGAARGGEYVVGWAKRGPNGLIGTNRADSAATVKAMLEDARASRFGWNAESQNPDELMALLSQRGVRSVAFGDWKLLDRAEVDRGKRSGKIREKFTRLPEMLSAIQNAGSRV